MPIKAKVLNGKFLTTILDDAPDGLVLNQIRLDRHPGFAYPLN